MKRIDWYRNYKISDKKENLFGLDDQTGFLFYQNCRPEWGSKIN
jgi:hypothetical protein